jgi:outer membrane protein assembly factor BamB
MAANLDTAAPPRRGFFRTVFPWLVVLIPAAAGLIAWYWPSDDLERGIRAATIIIGAMFSTFCITIWLLVYHRLLGWLALAAVGLFIAGLATGVLEMKKDGDIMPTALTVPMLSSTQTGLRSETHSDVDVALGEITAEDSPEYRGVHRDGVAVGQKLARDWKGKPPRLVWRHPVGGGYAGFAVAGNLAVTIEQRGDQEAVVGYDAATGKEAWVYAYPAHFTEPLGGPGPRATPTVHGGSVYSLGARGKFVCLDARNGKKIWEVDILENNDNLKWGMSGSPLVLGDGMDEPVVMVNPGVQKTGAGLHGLIAHDCKTGTQRWASGDTRAGYASPMLARIGGVNQILLFDGVEIAGYDPQGGKKLWQYPWKTHENINVAQPLALDGDRVFVSSNYGVGCAMLHLSKEDEAWSVKDVWRNTNMRAKMASPVLYQGHIYGLDDVRLCCLDAKTGERKWKGKNYGHGQLLLSDDLLVILDESGNLALVEATPQDFRELGSIPALSGRTWNYPALARGKIYVRNDSEMACYDLRE